MPIHVSVRKHGCVSPRATQEEKQMSKANRKKQNPNSDYVMADVLYQRLGNQWYAFTEKDGEVFMGPVDEGSIDESVQEEDFYLSEALDFIAAENKKLGPEIV